MECLECFSHLQDLPYVMHVFHMHKIYNVDCMSFTVHMYLQDLQSGMCVFQSTYVSTEFTILTVQNFQSGMCVFHSTYVSTDFAMWNACFFTVHMYL